MHKGATTMSKIQVNSIEVDKATEPTALAKRPVPLWHNRDYVLLWSGQMISSVGTQVSMLAFPLLVLAITHSPAQAGVVGDFCRMTAALFFIPSRAVHLSSKGE